MKGDDCLCFISLDILCLLMFETLVKNQIKSHDQFMQKIRKFTIVHIVFLATVFIAIILANESQSKYEYIGRKREFFFFFFLPIYSETLQYSCH